MECLQTLLEDEGIQNFLQEKESDIINGAETFHQFPEVVKTYVMENLGEFIAPTIEETHQNIVEFTQTAAFQYLQEIVESVEV